LGEQRKPSEEPAVFDTSSLIFLDVLGYIPFLRRLYRVVLPEAVSEELLARPRSPGSGVPSLTWVERRAPQVDSVRRVRRAPPTVGRGETEVIALGIELSCPVVLDDRKARLRARRAGLEIVGTLGILLRIHRLRLASRNLEDDLRLLEEADMRISPELRRRVLEAEIQPRDGPEEH
jgi:predicted nucleic acid-binding protein